MCKWLTVWRNDAATHWLADGPIHPQQQVLRRLDEAYRRFFAKTGGLPSFKRWGDELGRWARHPIPRPEAVHP
jgi:putative transposase